MAYRQICLVLLCMLCMSLASAAPDGSPQFTLSIRAGQALDEALQELARQTGVQLLFISQITAGRSAPELSGEYTLAAAMTRLLEGSDLTFRQVNEHTVEVRQAPPRSAALPLAVRPSNPTRTPDGPLEEVLVIGKAEQLVATRIPTPLKEIPQSISVISPEQIRQQNSFDLGDVLRNTPGVAVRRTSSVGESAFSRGFGVTSYHVDGGSALTQPLNSNVAGYQGTPDLSEFDRVEVLRGSDALFSGNNNPGGTVSLVRKRPLAKPSFAMSTALGSWNNYRVELDATGPLTSDGALRARADVVYATRDYFFDRAHQDRKKIFAVVEYDLTPAATLTAGGSFQWDDALPLMTTPALLNFNRTDAHLPRSTGLTFDWAYFNTRMSEAYLQYQQEFADDWILKLNASHGRTTQDYGYGTFRGIFLRGSQSLGTPTATFSVRPDRLDLDTVDATLTGHLDWFGLKETIAIGGDFARRRVREDVNLYISFGPPLTNVPSFDPAAYPNPRHTPAGYLMVDAQATLEQYGGFAWMQVDLNDAWSVSAGARVASDSFRLNAGLGVGAPGIGEFPDLLSLSQEFANPHVVQPYGALMYRINDQLSWYASYADIYRNQVQPYLRLDGKPFGPQHGVTYESGIKGAWRAGALNASLAVYRIEQRHVPARITGSSDAPWCCYGAGNGRSQGAELQVDGELAPGWLIGSGYTYNKVETATGDIPDTATPRHDLKIWTSAQLPGALSRWTVGGTLRAQSKFHGITGFRCSSRQGRQCLYDIVLMRPYAVVDLRAGIELNPTWQVALSVNNVLDKRYFLSHNVPAFEVWFGDPRNFMLRIDARY